MQLPVMKNSNLVDPIGHSSYFIFANVLQCIDDTREFTGIFKLIDDITPQKGN